MTATIPLPYSCDYVLANADSRYWYGQKHYEPTPPQLTQAMLRRGYARMIAYAQDRKRGFGNYGMLGRLLAGDADSSDLDYLLQWALLGEVKYG